MRPQKMGATLRNPPKSFKPRNPPARFTLQDARFTVDAYNGLQPQIGIRPGEKLHEVLFSQAEQPEPSTHPLIRSVYVPPVHGDCVRFLPTDIEPEKAAHTLIQLCLSMELDLDARMSCDLDDGSAIETFEIAGGQAAVGE
jgi:hypothetical protein